MTKYIGYAPVVGKKKTIAFESFCEICGKRTRYYWINPYNITVKRTLWLRLFSSQTGLTRKGISYSFHTWQLLLKKKKAVEVAACEECGQIRVKCLHCGNVEEFTKWQEVYICPNCQNKSYMIANHPLPMPFWYFRWD